MFFLHCYLVRTANKNTRVSTQTLALVVGYNPVVLPPCPRSHDGACSLWDSHACPTQRGQMSGRWGFGARARVGKDNSLGGLRQEVTSCNHSFLRSRVVSRCWLVGGVMGRYRAEGAGERRVKRGRRAVEIEVRRCSFVRTQMSCCGIVLMWPKVIQITIQAFHLSCLGVTSFFLFLIDSH